MSRSLMAVGISVNWARWEGASSSRVGIASSFAGERWIGNHDNGAALALELFEMILQLVAADLGIADGRLDRRRALLGDMPQVVRHLLQTPAGRPGTVGK